MLQVCGCLVGNSHRTRPAQDLDVQEVGGNVTWTAPAVEDQGKKCIRASHLVCTADTLRLTTAAACAAAGSVVYGDDPLTSEKRASLSPPPVSPDLRAASENPAFDTGPR